MLRMQLFNINRYNSYLLIKQFHDKTTYLSVHIFASKLMENYSFFIRKRKIIVTTYTLCSFKYNVNLGFI